MDVAIAVSDSPSPLELGDLAGRLEEASGRPVNLVLLDEAGIPLAYRVFRDGTLLLCRDRERYVARKARAVLDYLDFQPIEERYVDGILEPARRR